MESVYAELSTLALVIVIMIPGARFENFTSADVGNENSTLPNTVLSCGSAVCRSELDEVCSAQSICECPDEKDRRNESERCISYKQLTFPLLLARQQPTGLLLYNYSYADKDSAIHSNFVSQFESGMINVLQQCTFFQNFIRLSVDRILRPTDVNRTLSEGGLWVEFTLRLASSASIDEVGVYDELIRVISTNFAYSIGGISLMADRYQPPIQCFNNNCPRDGLCNPMKDRYTCQCQVGCRDSDPAKAGRICSCPCTNPNTYSCPQYSDCIPSDNRNGYVCKCKTGFVDVTSISHSQDRSANTTSTTEPQCVIDYCLQKHSDCESKNATCVLRDSGSECQCRDGYIDVRKGSSKMGSAAGAICLKPEDVNECMLKTHSCLPPSTCVESAPAVGYQCQCPDGSAIAPSAMCSLQSRASCAFCSQHGTCTASPDNSTIVCECDNGFSGDHCSEKARTARSGLVWKIGNLEIDWSWIAFGIGAGLGILLCLLLFTIVKVIQRQCRKKPTIRPSIEDEVFNFHEVTRNVYGVSTVGANKGGKLTGPLRSTSRTSLSEASTTPQHNGVHTSIPSPYAVSEVGVSTFKKSGAGT